MASRILCDPSCPTWQNSKKVNTICYFELSGDLEDATVPLKSKKVNLLTQVYFILDSVQMPEKKRIFLDLLITLEDRPCKHFLFDIS